MLERRCSSLGLGASYDSLTPIQKAAAQVTLESIADDAILIAVKSVSHLELQIQLFES
jgi:hypothetical protein